MTHAIVRVDIVSRNMMIVESGFEDGVAAQRAVNRIKATPHPGAIFIYGELVEINTTADDYEETLASAATAGGIIVHESNDEDDATILKVLVLGNVEQFMKYLKLLRPSVSANRQRRESRAARKERIEDNDRRYGSAAPIGSGKLPRKLRP